MLYDGLLSSSMPQFGGINFELIFIAAITNYHKSSDLTNTNILPYNSVGQKLDMNIVG